ncbi:flagellar basal body-associated FliL family protein [Jannaschia sp. W003]|uniref:flagellar basal body-associated FliL family protein n=1 Tax=Jannaschia sp. W003 TaxID=2867012 RepID=UPI0021A953A2|nr:flagellar basal body-associated FliL family protein [Jannaschia sp. W003]UWQ21831.1 flagellar basal body-associated protein FliL [Jannaschia sp. W003]
MKAVLGIVAILLFAAGGGAAAVFLRPPPEAAAAPPPPEPLPEPDLVNLTREFIVPIVDDGRVRGHVVLNLALQSETLPSEVLLRREAVLRDRLLEALFRHAGLGGFDGRFTDALPMNRLRLALNEAIRAALHPDAATVLVTAIDRRER